MVEIFSKFVSYLLILLLDFYHTFYILVYSNLSVLRFIEYEFWDLGNIFPTSRIFSSNNFIFYIRPLTYLEFTSVYSVKQALSLSFSKMAKWLFQHH